MDWIYQHVNITNIVQSNYFISILNLNVNGMFIQKRLGKFEYDYYFNFAKWEKLTHLVLSVFPDIIIFQEVNKWYFMPNYIPTIKYYVNETPNQIPLYDEYLKCMIFVKHNYYNQLTRIQFPRHIYNNYSTYNPLLHKKENHHWCIWIKLHFVYGNDSKIFIIHDLYQSPNRSINKYNDVANVSAELHHIKQKHQYDYLINAGDYNIKHSLYNHCKQLHLSSLEQQAINIMD